MSTEGMTPPEVRKLSAEEQARLDAWYQEHGKGVVREIRRQLRCWAATATGHSAVAQSVWRSIAEHHVDEMMQVNPNDRKSVERLLVDVARTHCWRLNKRAQRHPIYPIEGAVSADPKDEGETTLVTKVILRELEGLFESVSETTEIPLAGRTTPEVEGGIGLIHHLDKKQRNVLALKIAGRKRPEIANLLDLDLLEVDAIWKAIQQIVKATAA